MFVSWHLGACQEWWGSLVSTIYTFRLVMCGQDVFVVASAISNIDCRAAQPDVASCNEDTKVFDRCIVAMAVAERPVSLQALWRFIAMVRDCD